jgi:uncharacterized protein (TIGR02147 family)
VRVFRYLDYRKFITDEVNKRKRLGDKVNFTYLSRETGIQNTYLTNVLKGRAQLSSDQLYAVGRALRLKDDEVDYLLLLLDWERSSDKARRSKLLERIERLQSQRLETVNNLSVERMELNEIDQAKYYMDPYIQIVHIMLGLEGRSGHPEEISKALGLSKKKMNEILNILENAGFIQVDKEGNIRREKTKIHLPKSSPLCRPNQVLLRTKSIDHISKLAESAHESVSITFSADDDSYREIHQEFIRFLKRTEKIVQKTERKRAYQINFDLFPWDIRT